MKGSSRSVRAGGRGLARIVVFPCLFGGPLVAAAVALHRGAHPAVVIPVVHVCAALVIAACERLLPHRNQWNRSHEDVRTDAIHLGVSMVIVPELFGALAFGAVQAVASELRAWLSTGLWPTEWPLAGQVVLAVLLADFFYYWIHRAQHEVGFLWRLHATHHSASRLYWLNAARFHPLDTLLTYSLQSSVLVLLGAPDPVLALFLVVTGVHGMLQHANIDLRLGPLNWVFSMAELHRWHHSRDLSEANHNYGGNLILWDVLFGTRYLPRDRTPPANIGLADMPSFPSGYVGQLLSPFQWRALTRPDRAEPPRTRALRLPRFGR